MNYRNNTSAFLRLYEYWIIPKQYDSQTISDALLQRDWFTAHGIATDKDRAWAATYPSQYYDEPINPEKYTVVKKKVTNFSPGLTNSNNVGKMSQVKTSSFYLPINKKYSYGATVDGDTTNPLQAPVFYVSYVIDYLTPTGTVQTPAALTRDMHFITFFRDGESGMK